MVSASKTRHTVYTVIENYIGEFFSACKKLHCVSFVNSMGESARWLAGGLGVAGRGSGRSPTPGGGVRVRGYGSRGGGGTQRIPSKASGLQRLLVMLEGELFCKGYSSGPAGGAGQLAEVSQVVADLLDKFHLLI